MEIELDRGEQMGGHFPKKGDPKRKEQGRKPANKQT